MPVDLPTLAEIQSAQSLVYTFMPPTPQYSWPLLNEALGAEVWVKHENHTPVGAFKVRGGLVYMDDLHRNHPDVRGVVTATRGNHGQSVGFSARKTGLSATIVVPHGNDVEKNAAMRAFGVELIEEGADFQESREAARRLAEERGLHMIPSFDLSLLRGVATYALEFLQYVFNLDVVYVPIGMGSGICGMAAARNGLGDDTEIIGVTSAHAPAMALSFAAGSVVSHPSTTLLADGLACRTPDPTAFSIIRENVTRIVAVTDDEVAVAMRLLFTATHNAAEGAGAASLAAALQDRERNIGKRVGVVLCGGNVQSSLFADVLRGNKTWI